jgi:hypothetical protein
MEVGRSVVQLGDYILSSIVYRASPLETRKLAYILRAWAFDAHRRRFVGESGEKPRTGYMYE